MVSGTSLMLNFSISRRVAGLSRLRKISPKSKIIVLIIPEDLQIITCYTGLTYKFAAKMGRGNSFFKLVGSCKNPRLIPDPLFNERSKGLAATFNDQALNFLFIQNFTNPVNDICIKC